MFVTVEGIDGAGKTTLLLALVEELVKGGEKVFRTREPGGSFLGPDIRKILLSAKTKDLNPTAELLLFLADRAQHVHSVIRPALARGEIVLCDRYTDSTRAYQGGARGFDPRLLEELLAVATAGLEPDLTLLLDLPVACAQARIRRRLETQDADEGRFDAYDHDFHARVRDRYLEVAARFPERFVVMNAEEDAACLCAAGLRALYAAMERRAARQ